MEKCVAFVLGGGGARGALQVGALRALFEAGYQPDLLVGTSIGAANAAALAMWGVNLDGVAALERAYETVVEGQLMDSPGRLAWHALSKQLDYTSRRAREFLIAAGITQGLRFHQIENVRLGLIGADLGSGQPLIFGLDPEQSVLEGVLASCSVPPWFSPIESENQLIVDGGALSNLPIEPALTLGATEIIALDLVRPSMLSGNFRALTQFDMFISAIYQREINLEIALAEARGVTVRHLKLESPKPPQIWDFSTYKNLIETGYEIAAVEISNWNKAGRTI